MSKKKEIDFDIDDDDNVDDVQIGVVADEGDGDRSGDRSGDPPERATPERQRTRAAWSGAAGNRRSESSDE